MDKLKSIILYLLFFLPFAAFAVDSCPAFTLSYTVYPSASPKIDINLASSKDIGSHDYRIARLSASGDDEDPFCVRITFDKFTKTIETWNGAGGEIALTSDASLFFFLHIHAFLSLIFF